MPGSRRTGMKAMLRIKEAVIVEGRYDKIKLKRIVDARVFETGGFGVFNQKELKSLLCRVAEKSGIIIFTDSDAAGFMIRNHLKGILPKDMVKHAYIPQLQGREKRKKAASKEGLLGVEGISDEVIINALIRSGATLMDGTTKPDYAGITKLDFYNDGLSGKPGSHKARQRLLARLCLPGYMSSNALLEAVNILLSYDEYKSLVRDICHD